MTLPMLLEGRSVIVTGGARGIGLELSIALVSAGANVVATGRSKQHLAQVEHRAGLITSGRLHGVLADVRFAEDCERVASIATDRFGGVGALVNNAGVAMRLVSEDFETNPPPFWQIGVDAWREIVDTNVSGVFYMSRAAVPLMLEQRKGRLINISTGPRVMRTTGWFPYGASKAALESMSATWAQELAGSGVTVNVARPGVKVDTDLFPNGGRGARLSEGFAAPSIMNDLIVWLVSDASDGIHGRRFNASLWDSSKPTDEAARLAMLPYPELPHLF
jgi:NAD(P)-dependent dehydrogenase (short-subunit alcohol dehydrogenase family)